MQPNGPDRTGVAGQGELLGDVLGDLAGLDAAGAHVEALRGAVDDRPDPLDVGVPPTLRATVRVADVHPEGRVLDEHLARSEEHTSELQSLMRISYAVFCLKKKKH